MDVWYCRQVGRIKMKDKWQKAAAINSNILECCIHVLCPFLPVSLHRHVVAVVQLDCVNQDFPIHAFTLLEHGPFTCP
jgi:hypothetical protein